MVRTRRKTAYKRKKPSYIIGLIKSFISLLRKILSIPTVLPSLVIITLVSWFYYSGEYDNAMRGIDNIQDEIAIKSGLVVKDILLEGQNNTSRDDIISSISSHGENNTLRMGESLFNVNLKETHHKLEKLSWIKYASVERLYPGTINISIAERNPTALWQNAGKIYLLDEDGQIIEESNLEKFSDLIIMVGKNVPAYAESLLDMIKSEREIANMVSSATRISGRRWNIKLHNNIVIKLPEKKPSEAWKYLAKTHERTQLLSSNIKHIDLRLEDKMFTR